MTKKSLLNLTMDDRPLKIEKAKRAKYLISHINHIREKIDNFSKEDVPLYNKWFRSTFHLEVQANQDLSDNYQRLGQLLNQIVALSQIEKIEIVESWIRFQEEESILQKGNPVEVEAVQKMRRDRELAIAELLNTQTTSPFWKSMTPEDAAPASETQLNLTEEIELNSLFKQISIWLHPENLRNERSYYNWIDLWSQVELAYKNKNLFRLQNLLLLVAFRKDQLQLSVFDYNHLLQFLESEIELLNTEAARMKVHPAWGFTFKRTYTALTRRAKRTLTLERQYWLKLIKEVQEQLEFIREESENFIKQKTASIQNKVPVKKVPVKQNAKFKNKKMKKNKLAKQKMRTEPTQMELFQ